MKHAAIAAVLVGAAILAGCKQSANEAAAPQKKNAALTVKTYPVISQLDKFDIRPNECAGELERLAKIKKNRFDNVTGSGYFFAGGKLYYDYAGDPAVGGAALDMSASELTEDAWWYQSLDVNGDGLCDLLALAFSGRQSVGQQFSLHLRSKPGDIIDDAFVWPPIENDSEHEYLNVRFPSLGGPMPLPGSTGNDKTIVYRIHPKSGGTPYMVVASYHYAHGNDIHDVFPDIPEYEQGAGFSLLNSNPQLWVYRWNPKTRKFEDLTSCCSPTDTTDETREELFGPASAEYWSIRAYIAERHLADALKSFKARNYTHASLLMDYANAADPRNPDIWGWKGALHYVSGEFKGPGDGAAYAYDQAIAWTTVRNLPVQPILYFNQGLAYEAWCWKQIQDRREGEKPGCDDGTRQRAVRAYESYLKAAPNGERAVEARTRLADIAKGIFREPQTDPEMSRSADVIDRMAKSFARAQREIWQQAQAKEEAERAKDAIKQKPAASIDPETGQPVGAPTRDVFKLTPADLKKIDQEIARLLQKRGLRFEQSRIDWMIAYKAKFPGADLNDMIARPEDFEALPWVKKWRQTYGELPR